METERRPREQKPAKTLDDTTLDELFRKDVENSPFRVEYEVGIKKTYQELARFVHEINNPSLFTRLRNRAKPLLIPSRKISSISFHWQNFADNTRVQQAIGKENIDRAEKVISRSILTELFNSPIEHINSSFGHMDEFKIPTLAPFQILKNPGSSRDYLSGFSSERFDELKKTTVPGLLEIVEIVTKSPEPLTREKLTKFKTELTKMFLHYLKNGSKEERLYIARTVPNDIISEETKEQIREILESEKTPEAVTMEFFTSHISNTRDRSYNLVALELLVKYLAQHKNPKLKDLLCLYEGEIVDSFIQKAEFSPQDVTAISKTFEQSEENIVKALELAKRQKEQDPDNVRFSVHDRSSEGVLNKLIGLSDKTSLLDELSVYGFRLDAYQSLDQNLFNRLLQQRDTLIPFIQQLHAYGYKFRSIDELPNIEYAMENKDALLAAIEDIRRYDPTFTYYPHGKDYEYSDPYKLFMLNVSVGVSAPFYDRLLTIKKLDGHLPRRFSDLLFGILRDKFSPRHYDKRTYEWKRDKLPEPSDKNKIEFQKVLGTVLDSVSKDKEDNSGKFHWFYNDDGFLKFLTFNPNRIQEMLTIPQRFPDLPKLMADNRDAKNRLTQFLNAIFQEDLPQQAVAKVLETASKPTELDALGTKLLTNNEIAKMIGKKDWHNSLLSATSFEEANEQLTRIMTELAIPALYNNLKRRALSQKQTELVENAKSNHEFEEILEICCRSVGIYSAKYPRKGIQFNSLMQAIRTSLEFNLEHNPDLYAQKRFEQSSSQFDRVFEDFPQKTKEKVLTMWSDLSKRRRLRVSGSDITNEEATLSRLNRVGDLARNDLSIHLQALFVGKVKALEQEVGRRDDRRNATVDQLAILKGYLFTREGQFRQDIPSMYHSIDVFIDTAQKKLKDSETLREEKATLGRNLGTYQAMSDSLKALYKLTTISEERYNLETGYLEEINDQIGKLSASLKKIQILDPERRSQDVNLRALEEEVLIDFQNLKKTMSEENLASQAVFQTDSTVSFKHLAQAPDMTQSCQRLTEVTGFNQAAYSRLLDGINEMVDVYETENGERHRLSRSFIELSKVKIEGEEQPRLSILFDRQYVNPQYQNFTNHFYTEMVTHLVDRIGSTPEISIVIPYQLNPQIEALLKDKGYQARKVTAQYFVNKSNVGLSKYYDSAGGIMDVRNPYYLPPQDFYLIEKI